jgi:hypothetical protein
MAHCNMIGQFRERKPLYATGLVGIQFPASANTMARSTASGSRDHGHAAFRSWKDKPTMLGTLVQEWIAILNRQDGVSLAKPLMGAIFLPIGLVLKTHLI